jgi:hypothetical protein
MASQTAPPPGAPAVTATATAAAARTTPKMTARASIRRSGWGVPGEPEAGNSTRTVMSMRLPPRFCVGAGSRPTMVPGSAPTRWKPCSARGGQPRPAPVAATVCRGAQHRDAPGRDRQRAQQPRRGRGGLPGPGAERTTPHRMRRIARFGTCRISTRSAPRAPASGASCWPTASSPDSSSLISSFPARGLVTREYQGGSTGHPVYLYRWIAP